MRNFIYRLSSMALRSGCPFGILLFSSAETLGSYYLFTALFSVILFFISMEMAVPFSCKYLRAKGDASRRTVFSSLLYTQACLASLFAFPVALLYGVYTSLASQTIVLLFVLFVTEACINESTRFFWNVGLNRQASKRDLQRSLFFVISILSAVILEDKIITSLSLALWITFDLCLLYSDLARWGDTESLCALRKVKTWRRVKRSAKKLATLLKLSSPQFIHLQILSIQPFAERLLIERKLGVSFVGSYSFQFSLIQAGVSLLLQPFAAGVRHNILSSRRPSTSIPVHQSAMIFLGEALLTGTTCALAVYLIFPFVLAMLNKTLVIDIGILIATVVSVAAAIYSSAISPLYASAERTVYANAVSLLAMSPLALCYLAPLSKNKWEIDIVLLSIILSSTIQIAFRATYSVKGLRR